MERERERERGRLLSIKPQWWGKLKGWRRKALIGCTYFSTGRSVSEALFTFICKKKKKKKAYHQSLSWSEPRSAHWTHQQQLLTDRKSVRVSGYYVCNIFHRFWMVWFSRTFIGSEAFFIHSSHLIKVHASHWGMRGWRSSRWTWVTHCLSSRNRSAFYSVAHNSILLRFQYSVILTRPMLSFFLLE